MGTKTESFTNVDAGAFRLMREFHFDLQNAASERDLHRRLEMLEHIGNWLGKVARIWPEMSDFDIWFTQLERRIDETRALIEQFYGDGEGHAAPAG